MSELSDYLPQRINEGPFVTSYSLPALQGKLGQQPWRLPICSLFTPTSALAELGPLVLPPLYREALDPALQEALLERIKACFPCLALIRPWKNMVRTCRWPPIRSKAMEFSSNWQSRFPNCG